MFKKKILLPSLLILLFFLISSPKVLAFSLGDIVKEFKSLFDNKSDLNRKDNKLSIDSLIELAPGGDENNNGEIDSGDIVRFTYALINTTDNKYSYATLKTNIDRKQLNFIHRLKGATGLSDEEGTITFHNIRINPDEQRIISFDARLNYSQEDKSITTESEFIDENKKSFMKFPKKEVIAKKLSAEEIKKRLEKRGVTIKNLKKQ